MDFKNVKHKFLRELFTFFSLDKYSVLVLFTIIFTILPIIIGVSLTRTNDLFSSGIIYIQEEIYFFIDELGLVDADTLFSASSGYLVWFIVGAIVYLISWVVIVVSVDLYNNIVVSKLFLHPSSFHQSSYWAVIVGRFLFRFAALLLFISLLSWTFITYIPWSISLIISSLDSTLISLALGVLTVLASCFMLLYCYTVTLRILLMKKRILS